MIEPIIDFAMNDVPIEVYVGISTSPLIYTAASTTKKIVKDKFLPYTKQVAAIGCLALALFALSPSSDCSCNYNTVEDKLLNPGTIERPVAYFN